MLLISSIELSKLIGVLYMFESSVFVAFATTYQACRFVWQWNTPNPTINNARFNNADNWAQQRAFSEVQSILNQ